MRGSRNDLSIDDARRAAIAALNVWSHWPLGLLSVQLPFCDAASLREPTSLPVMCRFSDAGMTRLSTCCGGRRPKSAKARSRGKWGTGGAAGAV
jgi:hypothetical protein